MLKSSNVNVRDATSHDAAAVAAIYAPYVEGTAITFEEQAPTAEEMRTRIQQFGSSHGFLVANQGEQILGYAYAAPHRARASYRWSVDVSVFVSTGLHRAGVGRALYERLLPALAKRGFVTAYAGITLPNAGSVGLHESFGFTPVGVYTAVGYKLGGWRDVGWWQKRLVPELPAVPLPVGGVP